MSQLQVETAGERRLVIGRFGHFEAFSEAIRPWGLDFRQLDCGPSPSELLQISEPGLVLQRVNLGRLYDQRGEVPPGMLTLGVREEGATPVDWCGQRFGMDDIAVFPANREFEAASRPGFRVWTISIAEERLSAAAEDGETRLALRPLDGRVVPVDPDALRELRRSLRGLAAVAEGNPASLGSASLRNELPHDLPGQILCALASAPEAPRTPSRSTRQQALRRALDLIEQNLEHPPTVATLCREAGVSWRTLDYAFKQRFGVTPKAYLRAVRLNGARQELRRAGSSTVISDVANRWGFWHMGQFAADYRRLFGELPSHTRDAARA